MKSKLIILGAMILLPVTGLSRPSATELVAQGRGFLAAGDPASANASFQSALEVNAGDETANAFYALTRLLVLPNQPPMKDFLDRLDIVHTNLSVYEWHAVLPRDANGALITPENMSGSEAIDLIRTNVLREIKGAAENLSRIVSTNFLLSLSEEESPIGPVSLDRGDILLLQSLLHFAEYIGYTATAWRYDVQLSALSKLATNSAFSIEQLLSDHPALFTFGATNDFGSAQEAFSRAAEAYLEASEIIRKRPTDALRLFNYDFEMEQAELNFRKTLTEVKQSLNGPIVLTYDTKLAVHLGQQFKEPTSLRELLPEFSGNSIIAGTLPDETLGGVLSGYPGHEIERFLGTDREIGNEYYPGIPFVAKWQIPQRLPDGRFRLRVNALDETFFTVEASTDLREWIEIGSGSALEGILEFLDTRTEEAPKRFYRAIEKPNAVRFQGTVIDVTTEQPIPGAIITLLFPDSEIVGATGESSDAGHYSLYAAPPTLFGQAQLSVLAPSYSEFDRVEYFFEDQLGFAIPVYLAPPGYRPANDDFADRVPIPGTNIVVEGYTVGATQETLQPGSGNGIWWSWVAPGNGAIVIDTGGSLPNPLVDVYTGETLPLLRRVWSGSTISSFFVEAGTEYFIHTRALWSSVPGMVSMELNWILPEVPRITENPISQTVTVDDWAWFDAFGDGTHPVYYQWYQNGTAIPGATNTYLEVNGATPGDGGDYFAVISNAAGSATSRVATLTVISPEPPPNDDLVDAVVLTGPDVAVSASNAGASKEPGEPNHHSVAGGRSVWWSWTAAADGRATIDTSGSSFDTVLAVYTGNAIASLLKIASDDEGGDGTASKLTFQAISGVTYLIAVDGYTSGSTGQSGGVQLHLAHALEPGRPPLTLALKSLRIIYPDSKEVYFDFTSLSSGFYFFPGFPFTYTYDDLQQVNISLDEGSQFFITLEFAAGSSTRGDAVVKFRSSITAPWETYSAQFEIEE